MNRALAALVPALFVCGHPAPPPPATPLFESHAAYEPYRDKLAAAGGDVEQALIVRKLDDLLKLQHAQRYKFVLRSYGALAIAPAPADTPAGQVWVHPVLGLGKPALTAGYIRVDHEGPAIDLIALDQDSRAYCPTHASSQAAVDALQAIGVAADKIEVQDHPPKCLETMAR